MKTCIACGMPMTEIEDFGCGDEGCETCVHCTNKDGSVKSCEEIFEGGVQFFVETTWDSRKYAAKLVRYNMRNLCSHWDGEDHPCLEWPMVSKKEFETFLKKLQPEGK